MAEGYQRLSRALDSVFRAHLAGLAGGLLVFLGVQAAVTIILLPLAIVFLAFGAAALGYAGYKAHVAGRELEDPATMDGGLEAPGRLLAVSGLLVAIGVILSIVAVGVALVAIGLLIWAVATLILGLKLRSLDPRLSPPGLLIAAGSLLELAGVFTGLIPSLAGALLVLLGVKMASEAAGELSLRAGEELKSPLLEEL